MVKIALAGGSGNVASEIFDVLVATKKHEFLILSRRDIPAGKATEGVSWVKVDYEDTNQLAEVLKGVHTLLSFVTEQEDPLSPLQKNLINAAVQAGVKRFAPSEWGSAGLEHLSWYAYKGEIRKYLQELNKDKKVLEYTLFQPGLFVNYLTRPYKSSKHIHELETPWDFNQRRVLMLDGGDNDPFTLTTVQDLANVVARAIDFEGEWPVVGGIRGTQVTLGQLITLGEKIRGKSFEVERLKADDLKNVEVKSSWAPTFDHQSLSPEHIAHLSKVIVAGLLLALHAKAYAISDEWNKLLPDYKFTQAEDFLTDAWRGKP